MKNPETRCCPSTTNPLRRGLSRSFFVLVMFLLLLSTAELVPADSSPGGTETPASGTPKQPTEGSINLDATAHKRLPNSVADVTLAIQLDGKTADSVSSSLAQRSQTLLDFLRQQGVERLQTREISFEPQTEPVRGAPDRVIGFTGQAFVSFRTTPDKLGMLLSESLEHGANTISQTEFTVAENEIDAARRELSIEATKSALDRANTIAESVGERVVRIVNINVASEQTVGPVPFRAAKATDLSSPPPIATAAGERDISVRVSVQVAIERNSK
jgi:uncharacterized protein